MSVCGVPGERGAGPRIRRREARVRGRRQGGGARAAAGQRIAHRGANGPQSPKVYLSVTPRCGGTPPIALELYRMMPPPPDPTADIADATARLEELCESKGFQTSAEICARLRLLADRLDHTHKHAGLAFATFSRSNVFPLLELPLVPLVLAQLSAAELAVAAATCTAFRDHISEAARLRAKELGGKLPTRFDGEALTHALRFVEEFTTTTSYSASSLNRHEIACGTNHALCIAGGLGDRGCAVLSWRLNGGRLDGERLELAAGIPAEPSNLTLAHADLGYDPSSLAHLGRGSQLALSESTRAAEWAPPNPEHEFLATSLYGKSVVDGESAIVSVAAGRQHSLALSEAGEVWSWGKGLLLGRPTLGTGRTMKPHSANDDAAELLNKHAESFTSNNCAERGRVIFLEPTPSWRFTQFRVTQIACASPSLQPAPGTPRIHTPRIHTPLLSSQVRRILPQPVTTSVTTTQVRRIPQPVPDRPRQGVRLGLERRLPAHR